MERLWTVGVVVAQADEYAASTEMSARPDGRVTIPAQLRRAAGIEPGRRLVVYVENGRVVIEEREHLLERVQREAISAARAAGRTGSVVQELLAERRAEAAREETRSSSTVPAGDPGATDPDGRGAS